MKNYKQLLEDLKTNEELAKKLEETDKQMRMTGNKAGLIKAIADLGYEVSEQDFAEKEFSEREELVKLDEEELDNVAGGIFGFGPKAPDGHEIGCIIKQTYYVGADSFCPENHHDGHKYEYIGDDPDDSDYELFKCMYCGKVIFDFIGGAD